MDQDYGEELNKALADGAVPLISDGVPFGCPRCRGIGTIQVFKFSSGPHRYPEKKGDRWFDEDDNRQAGWYSGESLTTFCPVCQAGKLEPYLWEICGLADAEKNLSIDDFRPLLGKEKARQTGIDLLSMNKTAYGFVTFHGGFGTGKTFLQKIIINSFRMIGLPSRYTTAGDLLATIRERFGENAGSVESMISYFRNLQVLAIDEIDRISLTPWVTETLYRLLDSRFSSRHELVTIVACNLSPMQLPETLSYLASRMRGGLVVEVGGADMRPVMGLKERADIDG